MTPQPAHPAPGSGPETTGRPWLILTLVCTALFMTTLDNLVVTTALPRIRTDLNTSLPHLEWVLNAYTMSFAVLLLLGSALGDRYGRRRVFTLGLTTFTLASAAAALAPDTTLLIAARALQGTGAAVLLPLSLTLTGEAFPGRDRGLALGIWAAANGLGVALGPVVGGLVVNALSWRHVFWLNVPIGAIAVLAAHHILPTGTGPARRLDPAGAALVTTGLTALLLALFFAPSTGWLSAGVITLLTAAAALLTGFVRWERRAREPMLPMRLFAVPAFRMINITNVAMYFGTFGGIFLIAPFLQTVQGHSPLEAGLRMLPWTLMPLLVSPIAGIAGDRIGPRTLVATGLGLQATAFGWLAVVLTPDLPFTALLGPAVLGGAGMALVFPASAGVVLGAVHPHEAGQASGALNALREAGGALGVAVLATVFVSAGGTTAPQDYTRGMVPALTVAAVLLGAAVLAALRLPGPVRRTTSEPAYTAPVTADPPTARGR